MLRVAGGPGRDLNKEFILARELLCYYAGRCQGILGQYMEIYATWVISSNRLAWRLAL